MFAGGFFRISAGALLAASVAHAELAPEWISRLPVGSTLPAGLRGFAVDAAGSTYVAGNAGISSNFDTITAKFGPEGGLRWSRTYDGPAAWHDAANDLVLGHDGGVYVTGSTPGALQFADLLLLKYDNVGGALLWSRTYNGGAGISDAGLCLARNASGEVFVGGHTVGDGSDCLTVQFDPAGVRGWVATWDGPAPAPYSQEAVRDIAVDPNGDIIILTDGVMNTLHPDYVVIKYAAATGAMIWMSNWGVNGGDFPAEMVLDAAGDVYVTGVGIDLTDKFSTVKFRNSDGAILWQAYDWAGFRDYGVGIALDGDGGVYITGSVDPDGNQSNLNDNIYTVKRDADSGAFIWSHLYGANCIGCYDVPGDIRVDSAGHVLVAGGTSSPPYSGDVIMLVLDSATGQELDRAVVSGSDLEHVSASFAKLDGNENIYLAGEFYNVNSGVVDIHVMRFAALAGHAPGAGDLDGDGDVDQADLGILLANYGQSVPPGTSGDLDGDGDVDQSDLGVLLASFGCD